MSKVSAMNPDLVDGRSAIAPVQTTPGSWTVPIAAGLAAWVLIALGFLGLAMLMEERPQFAGIPVRFSSVELIQDSPAVVIRRASDDVALWREIHPDRSDIGFLMRARRDYRGLRTIIDMDGQFTGRYTISNRFDEPLFVLFKCPHPRAANQEPINTSGLTLAADGAGEQENGTAAWLWSGEIGARESREITVSFGTAALTGLRYNVESQHGHPIESARITIRVEDMPNVHFESAAGRVEPNDGMVVWERQQFLGPDHFSARLIETRSLFTALRQLVEIGPLVAFLFLVAVMSVVLTRRRLTALQIFTISAGYAFYFPLILYLSAKFSFWVALVIAAAVPGLLLLNYARWLLGFRLGVIGGVIFLLLYQIFPTLAAFAGWNRGLVLLCLGGVTLFVLIQLQNFALRRETALALFVAGIACTSATAAETVQVIIPGELIPSGTAQQRMPHGRISVGIARYEMNVFERYLDVTASAPVEVTAVGLADSPLFRSAVHLNEVQVPDFARLLGAGDRWLLEGIGLGSGGIRVNYRVPWEPSGNQLRASVPLMNVPSATAILHSPRDDLDIRGAQVWGEERDGERVRYEIGLSGTNSFIIALSNATARPTGGSTDEARDPLYGIRILESQQLTIVHSDGSCSHFAEFRLPGSHPPAFGIRLPDGVTLISTSVDGAEREKPELRNGELLIPLGVSEPRLDHRRVSLRLAFPRVKLKFIGFAEFELPQPNTTIGTLKWTIVLPTGFQTQTVSSGLDALKAPPDLTVFGDYGKILRSHDQLSFYKDLLPPIAVKVRLRYYQLIPGITSELGVALPK